MTDQQTTRYHDENVRIRRQVDAEIAFGRELDRHGLDYETALLHKWRG